MNITLLDPKLIATTASPKHIQSVIEDLVEVIKQQNTLAELVLRLNPNCNEIGAGMLANLQSIAKSIKE